jgi:hypothetical protein
MRETLVDDTPPPRELRHIGADHFLVLSRLRSGLHQYAAFAQNQVLPPAARKVNFNRFDFALGGGLAREEHQEVV